MILDRRQSSHVSNIVENAWKYNFWIGNLFAVTPDEPTDDSFDVDEYENDEGDDEYAEDYESTEKSKKPKTKSTRMEVVLPTKPNEADSTTIATDSTQATTANSQSKTKKMIHFPAVRSELVPNGFKGKIEDKREKHNLTSSKNQVNDNETKVNIKPDSFVTITKSVSGTLDNANTTPTDDKKFESTYYTKSSTCGYFTYTCNIVYGSNGRSKICRPKTPINGKC